MKGVIIARCSSPRRRRVGVHGTGVVSEKCRVRRWVLLHGPRQVRDSRRRVGLRRQTRLREREPERLAVPGRVRVGGSTERDRRDGRSVQSVVERGMGECRIDVVRRRIWPVMTRPVRARRGGRGGFLIGGRAAEVRHAARRGQGPEGREGQARTDLRSRQLED